MFLSLSKQILNHFFKACNHYKNSENNTEHFETSAFQSLQAAEAICLQKHPLKHESNIILIIVKLLVFNNVRMLVIQR